MVPCGPTAAAAVTSITTAAATAATAATAAADAAAAAATAAADAAAAAAACQVRWYVQRPRARRIALALAPLHQPVEAGRVDGRVDGAHAVLRLGSE